MLSCTLVSLKFLLEHIHQEDIMQASKFSCLWRCPWLVKNVAGNVLAMHREVTGSQSNHEIFSYLKTTVTLLGCFLYKNDFFAGYGNIVPKTVQGRLFCVLYALIGIPGTCFTRKSIGDKIMEVLTKLITNRLLWEMRFEKITSDSKSGAKRYVDNDCGNCGLYTTINGALEWFTWETRNGHISRVFNLLSRLWVQLILVITFRNLKTTLITHLFFWRLLEQ